MWPLTRNEKYKKNQYTEPDCKLNNLIINSFGKHLADRFLRQSMFVRSVIVVAAQLAHLLQCVVALHLFLATRDISLVAVAYIEQYYSVWQYILHYHNILLFIAGQKIVLKIFVVGHKKSGLAG